MQDSGRLKALVKTDKQVILSDQTITTSQAWLDVRHVMNKDVITVPTEESVISTSRIMSENKISSIIVTQNGTLAGIVTETDLLKRVVAKKRNIEGLKAGEIMTDSIISVSPDTSVLQASKLMEKKCIRRLPIIDQENLIGIVTQTDLTRALTSYGMWKDVGDIMSKDVAVISKDSTVEQAAEILDKRNISCVVITDDDAVVGMITERDIINRVISLERDPAHIRIVEVMSLPVQSVAPDCSVFSATRTMIRMGIRRLVIQDAGRLCGIVTQTDIFKVVTKKLQDMEDEHIKLLDNSENSIFTMDVEGKTTYVNKALVDLFEVSDKKKFINRPFLPEEFWYDVNERQKFVKKLKNDGGAEVEELTLKSSTGRKLYVTLFSTFTKNMQGVVNGCQGILQDVTERRELVALREAEKALEAANRDLQLNEVALRGSLEELEMVNKELKETQNQLFQSERLKSVGRLASGVAHEVKNPLAVILQGVEYLSREVSSDQRDVALVIKDIKEAIDKANAVIMGLLDFSSLKQLDMKLTDVHTVIEEALLLVKHVVDYHHVDLIEDLDENISMVKIDKMKIEQVFVNLLMNAIQVIDENGKITIRTKEKVLKSSDQGVGSRKNDPFRAGDKVVMITFEDNGPGILEADLPNIFDPFFTHKKRKEGTGLGLSIAKNIIDLHEGVLRIENRKEGGVIATVLLKV